MCLITLAWKVHPDYPLIVAANRDEFYQRAATPAQFWEEAPLVLAGRDLQAGGTWMGVTREGRFAALTNFREPGAPAGELSRGLLVSQFLKGRDKPADYAQRVAASSERYSGFSLLVGDSQQLMVVSNRGGAPMALPAGVHGLSNHVVNTPWPKVERVKTGMSALVQTTSLDKEALIALMADATPAVDTELPKTGVSLEMERLLSSPFIQSAAYGTRVTTVLLRGMQRSQFLEQTFQGGQAGERVSYQFDHVMA